MMRAEIQALRALALAMVLGTHFYPGRLPGGFLGVDVFFVLSGFLITGGLAREAERTGRVRVLEFWARRARRLLPASLLTLLVCALLSVFLLRTRWDACFKQIAAAALYAHNWLLRAYAVDYWEPRVLSPVLHFWSLSIEEQFYLAWPLIAAAVSLAAAGRGPRALRRGLAAAFGAVAAPSLVHGLRASRLDAADAYLSTASRAWEFGLGALLALAPEERGAPALRSAASWTGTAVLAACAVWMPAAQRPPQPSTLLPVAATLAVVWAGAPRSRWAPTRLYELAPVQALGAWSYSAYLWHWPVLVFLDSALGRPPGPLERAAAITFALALAWATKTFVEDPVRFRSPLVRLPARYSFAFSGAGMACVALLALGTLRSIDREIAGGTRLGQALLEARTPCFGAAARDPEAPCRNPSLERIVVPPPVAARAEPDAAGLLMDAPSDELPVEEFGAPAGAAKASVALIGDSHASVFKAAVEPLARERGWRGYMLVGCAATRRPRWSNCRAWNERMLSWLGAHPEVRTVFVAAWANTARPLAPEGFLEEWAAFPSGVRRIVVIRDNPRSFQPDCVERALEQGGDPAGCRDPRARALTPDGQAAAAARSNGRAVVLDLTPYFCGAADCVHVAGGVGVYRDEHHLTHLYAATLAPYLRRAYDRLPPEGGALARARR